MNMLQKMLSNFGVRLVLISLALMLVPWGVLKALAPNTVADGGVMGFLVYIFVWADIVLRPIGALLFLFAIYRISYQKDRESVVSDDFVK